MSNIDLSSYSKEELRDVLRVLKDYRTSLKQIGLRSEFSDVKIPKKNFFTIEYTSSADFDFIKKFADSACKKYFSEADLDTTKKFVVNEKII